MVFDIRLRGRGDVGFGRLDFDSKEAVCTGLGLMDHCSSGGCRAREAFSVACPQNKEV